LTPAFAQEKISLENIWSEGTFRQQSVTGLRSMKDGEHYSNLNMMRNTVEKVDYKTGKEKESLFKLGNYPELFEKDWIMDYEFSKDESKILISTDYDPIYRHSYKANFYICDLSEGKVIPVKSDSKIQIAEISPKGDKVGYVFENNIYIYDIASEKTNQITTDGEMNKVINGAPDWVYEEEFSFAKAWEWSGNGDYIAFLKTEESSVKEFDIAMYGKLYPENYSYKYPKAGMKNSDVGVYIYSLKDNKTTHPNLEMKGENYIPRLNWTIQPNVLLVTSINRLQNDMRLHRVNAKTNKSDVILDLKAEKYMELYDDLTFMPDGETFVLSHETDGYRHLYRYDLNGNLKGQITKGEWEITDFYGYDDKAKVFYYQSAEKSPLQRDIYRVSVDGGDKICMNEGNGTTKAVFSKGYQYYIQEFTTENTPVCVSLHNASGEEMRVLEDNAALRKTMEDYGFVNKEFFTVKADDGTDLNAWMIKPANFKKHKKYPVLMYVYGGPGSQTVQEDWDNNMAWWQMLAQQGYIIVSVDNRGTGARGRDFRQVTYRELGKYETLDQIAAARQLGEMKFIDANRIGMFGWSYGGYMTNLCMTIGADVFSTGIAVAPVTNWRYYDSVYTERYNGLPKDNAEGYDANSPINHVEKLKGKLLLIHGSADDNVHYQNSMEFITQLVAKNKQFDLMIYPNCNHGIYGGNTRLHLYTKMTNFLKENL
jgi:dipeptidyl-peptidase-4